MVDFFEALKCKDSSKNLIIYNGGTDLMVHNSKDKEYLFINSIQELKKIYEDDNNIYIGAGVSYAEMLNSKSINSLLKKAISNIASPAVRNLGTMTGNVCNASPAGDTLPILYILNAKLKIASIYNNQYSCREELVEDFIKGIRKIDLKKNEIVEQIIIPKEKFTNEYYLKVGARKSEAISKISFAGVASIENNIVKDIRVAFGAVGITVVRAKEIEKIIIGNSLEDLNKNMDQILEKYSDKINPIDDQRSTAAYRKKVALNLLKDFLQFNK